jgi:hypothetical protein
MNQQFTVAEYSKISGKSKQSIYNRIKRNTISHSTVDGIVYIEVEQVEQPLNSTNNEFKSTIKQPVGKPQHPQEKPLFKSNFRADLNECREMIKELRKEIKNKDKEIKRLNKQLNKEKDNSIDVLKQFIGEMKVIAHKNEVVEAEIIEETPKKKKKKDRK